MAEANPKLPDAKVSQPPVSTPRAKLTADHPLMRELLAQYIGGLPAQVSEIVNCAKLADLDRLRQLSHQLKGSGGSYGFPQITQLAARAEASIMQGNPLRQIRTDVQLLIDLVRGIPGYEIAKETTQREAA